MFMVCGTKSQRNRTKLDAYTSKMQNVIIRKKRLLDISYLFIYLGLHTNYISTFTCFI